MALVAKKGFSAEGQDFEEGQEVTGLTTKSMKFLKQLGRLVDPDEVINEDGDESMAAQPAPTRKNNRAVGLPGGLPGGAERA